MRKTTGISLLLLIFLSLSLLIFSLLSYSGAQADARLSQKAADHTTEYYQMTGSANEVLSFIDAQLLQLTADANTSDTLRQELWEKICSVIHKHSDFSEMLSTKFPDVHFVIEEKNNIPSITFDIAADSDAAQVLHVTLEFALPDAATDSLYQITSWNIINTQDWTPDQSLDLLRISN